ncbi:MAG: bifunctional glutamate N-acetyltransferase/amino-acid acetyltransferase ArgJ [Micrococcales bacterium]|nr:bifunctional glutamate N-acetyltransferase/amino-acid acetyltransferase ArgJ [Micrococcales bacterium]
MSITFPKGFKAAGVSAGLKPSGALDVALVQNTGPADQRRAAARFTTNRFPAAPVVLSRRVMASSAAVAPSAVVLNSGGANACTGEGGMDDAVTTAEQVAAALGLPPSEVLVCSTGLIGERLDMAKLGAGVSSGIGQLDTTKEAGLAAATAIKTTDTTTKQAQVELDGYRLGGMGKGAGMLAPELATMLVVLTTDALISQELAEQALATACAYSFDRVDSDGCMSTNDTVILLSSGQSGVKATPETFTKALTQVCQDLGWQMIADAEGADHEIAITVGGASSEAAALAVARVISRSNLFKTAIAGRDPNWGRVLSAAGTVSPSVAPFQPDRVDVRINGIKVCQGGAAFQARDLVDLAPREVRVDVDLNNGQASATIWTNDLTHSYISINADYST